MNIFKDIPINKKDEEFLELFKNKSIRIERIVSNGQKSEKDFWYDQAESEYLVLLEGRAIIEFENKVIELNKGDTLNIEANKRHRVKYTSEDKTTIWLAIFYI